MKEVLEAKKFLKEAIKRLDEMGTSRKDAQRILNDLQYQIAEHIFKIVYFGKISPTSHWYSELEAWRKKLSNVNVAKGLTKRNFKKSDFDEKIYEQGFGEIANIDHFIKNNDPKSKKIDISKKQLIQKNCKEFSDKFANCVLKDISIR